MPHTMTVRVSKPAGPSLWARMRQTLQIVRGVWTGPIAAKDPALARLFGSGYESAAGIVVTAENAFTFSAVFDAVNQLASDPAKLPLNLRKRRKEGGSDDYEDSKLYWLLKYEPNPEMSSMVFRRTLLAHALTCHGGYAEIERDTFGRPSALWILTPDRVQVHREKRGTTWGPLEYLIDGQTILSARDVLHVSGLGYDGISGYAVIDKARQAIGLALAAEKFGAQFFGKGTVFGGWLETDEDLDEDQVKEIKASLDAFRAAQDSAFRTLITGRGRKYHQFATDKSGSQMNESRVTQVLEVARFFRMPPHRLGVTTPGAMSYASVEAANLDYYTGPILDWCTLVEQEFNRKLISPLERRQQFIKHNVTAFLRGDTTARSAFYEKMLDRGVFNADDVLALEDMNPQPNGLGKLYLVQAAQVPKDRLAELADAQIEKTKQDAKPAPAPAPAPAEETDAIREALIRAERAEAALAEVRAAHEAAKAHVLELTERDETTAAELTAAQEAVHQAGIERVTLEVLANEARATVAELEQARVAERLVAQEAIDAADAARADAVTRAEDAERLAADALSRAEEAARQRAEADAVREAAEAAARVAAQRVAEADAEEAALRKQLQALHADRDADAVSVAETRQALEAAEARALAAQQAQSEAVTAHDAATTELARAVEAHASAHTLVERAAAQLAETRTALEEAEAARAALAAAQVETTRSLTAEQQRAEALAVQLAAVQETLKTEREKAEAALIAKQLEVEAADEAKRAAEARVVEVAAEIEATRHAADEARRQAEAREATAEAARCEALDRVVAMEASRQAADAAAAVAQREAAAAQQMADEARQQAEAVATREAARAAAVVPAHRALMADAMRRVTSREVAQARRAQATPEKLRKWLRGLDAYHEAICRDIVAPAIRAHVAHLAGPDGAAQVEAKVDTLIAAHLTQLRADVERVLDAPPEDFHAVLDRWLTRWETERPDQVADALLGEEIDHGRRT